MHNFYNRISIFNILIIGDLFLHICYVKFVWVLVSFYFHLIGNSEWNSRSIYSEKLGFKVLHVRAIYYIKYDVRNIARRKV